jgi:hypothetical protein
MNIRIAALGLALITLPVLAQKYATDKGAPEQSAALRALERGKRMKGSRDEYRHLTQVFAVPLANSSETPEQAIARTEKGAQLVETKGRFVLFRSAQSKPAPLAPDAGPLPTAVNARTGALGIITGAVIVKTRSMSDADAIASGHGLVKSKAYPQLNTVYYRATPGVDIADLAAALQSDPRVESAYPEIIEYMRVPK